MTGLRSGRKGGREGMCPLRWDDNAAGTQKYGTKRTGGGEV